MCDHYGRLITFVSLYLILFSLRRSSSFHCFLILYSIFKCSDLPGVRMVGNLPFNVSIPLLLQWLEAIPMRAGPFAFGRTPMALVFQKEVADVSEHKCVTGS